MGVVAHVVVQGYPDVIGLDKKKSIASGMEVNERERCT